jgi:hypothetical protein
MEMRLIGFIVASLLSTYAMAGLGDAATPVSAAPTRMKAMQRPAAIDRYTVTEIQTSAGFVKEYVSTQGVVFAVSWRSQIMPDLHELLGSYFPSFERAAVASRSGGRRGPLNIDQADLVLQSAGRMRDFRGRAYVPALLPPNIESSEIQ